MDGAIKFYSASLKNAKNMDVGPKMLSISLKLTVFEDGITL